MPILASPKPVVIKANAAWKQRKMVRLLEGHDLDFTVRPGLGVIELPSIDLNKNANLLKQLNKIADPCLIEVTERSVDIAGNELRHSMSQTLRGCDTDYLVQLIRDGHYPAEWDSAGDVVDADFNEEDGFLNLYVKAQEDKDATR